MDDKRHGALMLNTNAERLVAGAGVEDVRRRFKQLAISCDYVHLEMGVRHISAGDGFSQRSYVPGTPVGLSYDVQAQEERDRVGSEGLSLTVEPGPRSRAAGRSDPTTIGSSGEIVWRPNLAFFLKELPGDTRWVNVFFPIEPTPQPLKAKAEEWARRDYDNPVLATEIDGRFGRYAVADGINHDLVLADNQGFVISVDPLHQRALNARWGVASNWNGHGAVVSVLYPWVGDLDWESINRIRKVPAIEAFRRQLECFELEARDAVLAGRDPISAVHLLYERHLAGVQEKVSAVVKASIVSIIVGVATDMVTSGLSMPASLVPGAGLGAISLAQQLDRRRTSWVSCDAKIRSRS